MYVELPRIASTISSHRAIQMEKAVLNSSSTKTRESVWETVADAASLDASNMTVSSFQSDMIDILPDSWVVVSLSLSESKEEITFSKMRAHESPFVISVPLTRQHALECNEVSYGYFDVKQELEDIIHEINQTSQNSKDLKTKTAKSAWWETRTALDARLQELLQNIENIWLGGFRSILSPRSPALEHLARLNESLQNSLDKHLPSRNGTGATKRSPRIALSAHVLQLFTSLGYPSECNDVDEQVQDLLYFVIDILQFKGERNAYDEIDFDILVIETLDALRQFHKIQQECETTESESHVILVVDKHLHCFPWESLPCMEGKSVSRVPSMVFLRERILQQRQPASQCRELHKPLDARRVNRHDGAFILNPSGDLVNTQKNFEAPLQSVPGWEGIIQRAPEESEFKGCLEDHDIFLYFGHGSGGQYIRSRTIKKLEKCAVALLMGCSSGVMTEAGEFESYGTPLDYMHAGSPAVLANLWDVTDKDIDRFAESVLQKWGLFEKKQQPGLRSPVKKGGRQKGKQKAETDIVQQDVRSQPVSLDTAVAKSREACILRYLNGAAPVIYGVPVILDG